MNKCCDYCVEIRATHGYRGCEILSCGNAQCECHSQEKEEATCKNIHCGTAGAPCSCPPSSRGEHKALRPEETTISVDREVLAIVMELGGKEVSQPVAFDGPWLEEQILQLVAKREAKAKKELTAELRERLESLSVYYRPVQVNEDYSQRDKSADIREMWEREQVITLLPEQESK